MSDVSVLPGQAWLAFTRDHDEDKAARTFEERFGQPPEHVVDHGGYLWLGPVPGAEV
jgi:hypothetical protein